MKDIIDDLALCAHRVTAAKQATNTKDKEHGSPDQTRGMLLESMFNQALGDIYKAIEQLKILDRELY